MSQVQVCVCLLCSSCCLQPRCGCIPFELALVLCLVFLSLIIKGMIRMACHSAAHICDEVPDGVGVLVTCSHRHVCSLGADLSGPVLLWVVLEMLGLQLRAHCPPIGCVCSRPAVSLSAICRLTYVAAWHTILQQQLRPSGPHPIGCCCAFL